MAHEHKDTHEGMQASADRMQDRAGGMVGLMTASGTSDPDEFIRKAAIGDLYEISAAKLVLRRSRSEKVKFLAGKMVDDHRTAAHQMKSTLHGIPDAPKPPKEPDDRRKKMLDHLEKAAEDEFDETYLEQQELAHQENLALFRSFCDDGRDPRLQLFARGTLPDLERHLQMVREARGKDSGRG